MSQRKAVTLKKAAAYRRSDGGGKTRILNELVDLTGWHRDYCRAALRTARPNQVTLTKQRSPRSPLYGPGIVEALAECWRITRRPAGKRLAPMLGVVVPMLIRDGDLDLVGHEGGNSSGEFCFTLTATDIATGWTINRSVRNKAAVWVLEAPEHVLARFPFPVFGIDSDNGSEFINHHLFDYCAGHKITFTRSRPANSFDGAHVEQKNWTQRRCLVGYLRYDTAEELNLLNEIWELDAGFTNHLLTQQKLVSKHRDEPKVIKRYDRAQTPHRRTEAFPTITESTRRHLDSTLAGIHPGHLSRQINLLAAKLETMALTKAAAPVKPLVNRSFVNPPKRRFPGEATKGPSRRF